MLIVLMPIAVASTTRPKAPIPSCLPVRYIIPDEIGKRTLSNIIFKFFFQTESAKTANILIVYYTFKTYQVANDFLEIPIEGRRAIIPFVRPEVNRD